MISSRIILTRPTKTGHVGTQNFPIFQTFITHNFLYHHAMETKFPLLIGYILKVTNCKNFTLLLNYHLLCDGM